MFENNRVRVLETRTAPGETVPPHTLENVGPAELHVISVELKDRA